MAAILRLIAAGVPAAKIIAKYGKKAYNAAKLEWKGIKRLLNIDKPVKIYGKEFKPAKIYGKEFKDKPVKIYGKEFKDKPAKIRGKEFKDKPAKIRGKEFEQKKGGKIKTYAKGSIVRKPKY